MVNDLAVISVITSAKAHFDQPEIELLKVRVTV
jgi:hypothetical protein